MIASEICDGTENCQSPGYIVTGKLLCTYAICILLISLTVAWRDAWR